MFARFRNYGTERENHLYRRKKLALMSRDRREGKERERERERDRAPGERFALLLHDCREYLTCVRFVA